MSIQSNDSFLMTSNKDSGVHPLYNFLLDQYKIVDLDKVSMVMYPIYIDTFFHNISMYVDYMNDNQIELNFHNRYEMKIFHLSLIDKLSNSIEKNNSIK